MCFNIFQKMKSLGAFCIVLLLFPFVVSVFLNGGLPTREEDGEQRELKVKTDSPSGGESTVTMKESDYLTAVLAKELPPVWHKEAMKAQAVIARTALCQELEESGDGTVSLPYMTHREMEAEWQGENYKEYIEKYKSAVTETNGETILYQKKYAWAPFHRSSTGRTRNASEATGSDSYPYVTAKDCPSDKECEDSLQTSHFTYQEIQNLCRGFLVAEEKEKSQMGYVFSDYEIISKDEGGYVKQMRIGKTVCTGDQFRDALGLASSAFQLTEEKDGMKITTTGIGHGLGMSQWTAQKMAEEGKSYRDILDFFFEGTEISE